MITNQQSIYHIEDLLLKIKVFVLLLRIRNWLLKVNCRDYRMEKLGNWRWRLKKLNYTLKHSQLWTKPTKPTKIALVLLQFKPPLAESTELQIYKPDCIVCDMIDLSLLKVITLSLIYNKYNIMNNQKLWQ